MSVLVDYEYKQYYKLVQYINFGTLIYSWYELENTLNNDMSISKYYIY